MIALKRTGVPCRRGMLATRQHSGVGGKCSVCQTEGRVCGGCVPGCTRRTTKQAKAWGLQPHTHNHQPHNQSSGLSHANISWTVGVCTHEHAERLQSFSACLRWCCWAADPRESLRKRTGISLTLAVACCGVMCEPCSGDPSKQALEKAEVATMRQAVSRQSNTALCKTMSNKHSD